MTSCHILCRFLVHLRTDKYRLISQKDKALGKGLSVIFLRILLFKFIHLTSVLFHLATQAADATNTAVAQRPPVQTLREAFTRWYMSLDSRINLNAENDPLLMVTTTYSV